MAFFLFLAKEVMQKNNRKGNFFIPALRNSIRCFKQFIQRALFLKRFLCQLCDSKKEN